MNLTRTVAFLAGAGALAALVFGAVTSRHELPAPIAPRRTAVELRGADLAKEIDRLHERLRPDATPRQPGRNLFSFHARVAPPAAPVAPVPVLPPAPPAPPPNPFRLVGIAEDGDPGNPVRTAFISAEGQLFVAKEGDAMTPRFKVTRISADVVEITDVTDGSTRRIAFK